MASRINKLDAGFEAATPNNLPIVDFAMAMEFIQNSTESFETQGWKLKRSSRESYGDNAIGYVQVNRDKHLVLVKARITPEHSLKKKAYTVSAEIDEEQEVINFAKCHDCAASEGECKHAIAFVMWLNRRTESTSTECYWKKSFLSTVIDPDKVLKISEISSKPPVEVAADLSDRVLNAFLLKEPKDCQLYLHFSDVDNKIGSIHSLVYRYLRISSKPDAKDFLTFLEIFYEREVCIKIEENTRKQSKSPFWLEIRYGRITASKLYEVSKCNTPDGSLVSRILGSSKFKGNFATHRGVSLEEKVIKQLETQTKQKFESSGFLIDRKYPFFGASPDAISDTHVVEIKCQTKEATVTDYILRDGTIAPKYYAQIQSQMFLARKKKGFFCVADPKFEQNSKIEIKDCLLNKRFCQAMLETSREFWKNNIYPRIIK